MKWYEILLRFAVVFTLIGAIMLSLWLGFIYGGNLNEATEKIAIFLGGALVAALATSIGDLFNPKD